MRSPVLHASRFSSVRMAAALALLALAGSAHASVLTFDGTFFHPGGTMSNSYGDRVVATGNTGDPYQYGLDCGPTPNVVLEYASGDGVMHWKDTGYGDFTNFIYVEHDAGVSLRTLDVTLSYIPPPPGNGPPGEVYLYGFDIGAELGETLSINEVRVIRTGGPAPNGVIFTQTNVVIPGEAANPTRRHIMFDPPLHGQSLTIQLDLSSLQGKSDRIAIDNIKFGETFVPSAGSGSLIIASLGLLASRRRREQRV